MIAYADQPDDALARRALAGERGAFAVLYHRHVRHVHATVAATAGDDTAARERTVAVFADLLRRLPELEPEPLGETLHRLAQRRATGHTGGGRIPPLTVGAVDEMWRELDRRWPTGDAPRRDVGTIVPITVGALIAAVVLGTLLSTGRRGGTPDTTRTYQAVPGLEEGAGEHVLPELPRPPALDRDALDPSSPEPPPTSPTPTPTPTPTPPATPSPEPEAPAESPESTEEPTETDEAPQATIVSPSEGETRRADGEDEQGAYATFVLEGRGTDDNDPPEELAFHWSSDREGPLGSGATTTARLHLREGELTASHRLTLTVTDHAGNTATDVVTVIVTRV